MAAANTGAWVRTEDNTYGSGKFPFGRCETVGCTEAACHRISNDNGGALKVCQSHLSPDLFFVPFLGQQEKLFAATERWVLGGGGAGGSKTYAGARLYLKQWQAEQARFESGEIESSKGWALFCRRTIPELQQVIDDFKRYVINRLDPGAKWSEQQKICTFTNGYKVQFGGMEDDDSYLKYYGGEYTLIVLDEATQFTRKQIQEVDARLRCSDPVLGATVQLYLLTNPVGGDTKAYLKRRFVNVAPPETSVPVSVKLADGRTITERQVYIPCNLYDNPSLVRDGKYEATLQLKGSAMKRALLLNDWDVDEGSWLGEDWDPTVHVCKPFAIPASWTRFKAMDYGYGRSDQTNTRSAVHWYAVDPEGNMVCYRSYSCRGKTARELGWVIRKIEREPLYYAPKNGKRIKITDGEWDNEADCSNVMGPADAAIWASQGEAGESRGEILEKMGCGFYRSDKGKLVRHSAAEQIRWRLRNRTPDAQGNADPGVPGLRFFSTCYTPIRDAEGRPARTGPIDTIPNVPFDPNDPDVWDTNSDDHDLDTLAYAVSSRPSGGERDGNGEDAEVIDFFSFRDKATEKAAAIDW